MRLLDYVRKDPALTFKEALLVGMARGAVEGVTFGVVTCLLLLLTYWAGWWKP